MKQSERGEARGRRGRSLTAWAAVLLWVICILGGYLALPLLNLVKIAGGPLGYWFAALGSLLILLAGTTLLAHWQDRQDARSVPPPGTAARPPGALDHHQTE